MQKITIFASNAITPPLRRYDFDALRALVTLLIVYYHSAKLFDANTWIIGSAQTSRVAGAFICFLLQWIMPLFFLLAGANTRFALEYRSSGEYLRERIRRLLVPFFFGILLIIPPQVYIERISSWACRRSDGNFTGSFFQFYPHFFESCYPRGNFTWNHLWFIIYLFLYSLLMLPLALYLKRNLTGQRLARNFVEFFSFKKRIFLLALPIIVIEVGLRRLFPDSHMLYNDWTNHAHFSMVFFYGMLLAGDTRLTEAISRNRWLGLLAGIALTSSFFVTGHGDLNPYSENSIRLLLWSAGEWCWLIALLGCANMYLHRPSAALRHASQIAYTFYILHQTIIIIIAYFVLRWNESSAIQFLIISALAIAITALLCELLRLTNITRFMFGMPMNYTTRG